MNASDRYMDTSALVPLFVNDAHSGNAAAAVSSGLRLLVSDFASAEVASVLGRRVRTGSLSAERAKGIFSNFEHWKARRCARLFLESADVEAAELLLRRFDMPLRAPDALHLAMTSRIGASLCTFDLGMRSCAERIGLPCVNV